jgi:hypothetical protein
VVVLVLAVAAPISAKQGDVVKFKETYSIPEDLADVGDLGQLNIACSGGHYTLVDGMFKQKVTTIFYPSEAAWLAGEAGATMTWSGMNTYTGLWNVDTDPEARFKLRDNNPHFEFTFGTDGSETTLGRWSGRFIDTDSGTVVDWWEWNGSVVDGVLIGTWDGTCLTPID